MNIFTAFEGARVERPFLVPISGLLEFGAFRDRRPWVRIRPSHGSAPETLRLNSQGSCPLSFARRYSSSLHGYLANMRGSCPVPFARTAILFVAVVLLFTSARLGRPRSSWLRSLGRPSISLIRHSMSRRPGPDNGRSHPSQPLSDAHVRTTKPQHPGLRHWPGWFAPGPSHPFGGAPTLPAQIFHLAFPSSACPSLCLESLPLDRLRPASRYSQTRSREKWIPKRKKIPLSQPPSFLGDFLLPTPPEMPPIELRAWPLSSGVGPPRQSLVPGLWEGKLHRFFWCRNTKTGRSVAPPSRRRWRSSTEQAEPDHRNAFRREGLSSSRQCSCPCHS